MSDKDWLGNGLPTYDGEKDRSLARSMIDRLGGPSGFKTAYETNADGSVTTVQLKGDMPPQVTTIEAEEVATPTRGFVFNEAGEETAVIASLFEVIRENVVVESPATYTVLPYRTMKGVYWNDVCRIDGENVLLNGEEPKDFSSIIPSSLVGNTVIPWVSGTVISVGYTSPVQGVSLINLDGTEGTKYQLPSDPEYDISRAQNVHVTREGIFKFNWSKLVTTGSPNYYVVAWADVDPVSISGEFEQHELEITKQQYSELVGGKEAVGYSLFASGQDWEGKPEGWRHTPYTITGYIPEMYWHPANYAYQQPDGQIDFVSNSTRNVRRVMEIGLNDWESGHGSPTQNIDTAIDIYDYELVGDERWSYEYRKGVPGVNEFCLLTQYTSSHISNKKQPREVHTWNPPDENHSYHGYWTDTPVFGVDGQGRAIAPPYEDYLSTTEDIRSVLLKDYLFFDREEDISIYLDVHHSFSYTTSTTVPPVLGEYAPPDSTLNTSMVINYVLNIRGTHYNFEMYNGPMTTLGNGYGATAYTFGNIDPAFPIPYTSQGNCPFIAYTTKAEEAAGAPSEIYVDLRVCTISAGDGLLFTPLNFTTWAGSNLSSIVSGMNTRVVIQFANGVIGPWASLLGDTFTNESHVEISRI